MERNLYEYRDIAAAYNAVAATFSDLQEQVLGPVMEHAAEQSKVATAELHSEIAGFEVGRDITVVTGPVKELSPQAMHLPVHWTSTRSPALFPAMEGVIEISAQSDSPPRTQVAFIGHYTPPLGAVGSLGDALIGHTVAAKAITHLLEDVATRLESAAQSRAT